MKKLMIVAAAGLALAGCRMFEEEELPEDCVEIDEELAVEPRMIELQARFVKVEQETLDEIGAKLFPGKEKGHRYDIADFESVPAKRLEELLIARRDLIANEAPRAITRTGEETVIKSVSEMIYPTDFDVQMSEAPCCGTNAAACVRNFGIASVEPQSFTMREIGTILDFTPTLTDDGNLIDIRLNTCIVEPPRWQEYGMELPSPNGGEYTLPMNQPVFSVRSIDACYTVAPGETLLVGSNVLSGKNDITQLIFVRARVLDTKGHEVKSKQ